MPNTCRGCEASIPSSRANPRQWCSEACRVKAYRRAKGRFVQSDSPDAQCVVCDSEFIKPTNRSTTCSEECRHKESHRRHHARRVLTPSWPCPDCGVAVERDSGVKFGYRCTACRRLRVADRNRRKNTRRRRAAKPGAYSLAEIAERDGERCHLCGKRVDMSMSGNDPSGPTIDHLVPISCGGDDVPENVALAHRTCNCTRGAGGEVQLLLVG